MIVLKYIFACCSCFSIVPVYVWIIMNKCFLQSLPLNSSLQRNSLKTLQKNTKPLRNVANSEKVSKLKSCFKKLPFEEQSELGIFEIIMGMVPSNMLCHFSFRIPFQKIVTWLFRLFLDSSVLIATWAEARLRARACSFPLHPPSWPVPLP